ncbi:MAG: LPS export ABC transporter permease LptF [Nitrospirae bacterium GWC2_56_14]|nr:MAG: LPS export ABC transporter permease LptF [Nitrospirae bacterium GWC2_56_14]
MFKIKVLDRYIFEELLPPFFLSMFIITLVLFIQKMFRLAELVISKGVTVTATLKLLAFILPGFLVITIPMSALVAAITAFSRLSSDSEITAMKTSRVSLYRMLRPVTLFAFLAFSATALTSLVLLPAANTALKAHLFNMVKSQAMVGIEAGVFSSAFDGMVIYVDKMESLDKMEGIFISDEHSAKDPYSIVAKRGKLITDPQSFKVTLAMEEGSMYSLPRDKSKYLLSSFAAGSIFLDINRSLLQGGSSTTDYRNASIQTLLTDIRSLRAQGKPTFQLESELHMRLSIPVACLIFGIIGAPLGIRKSRSGRSAGIAIALAVFFLYYVLIGTSKNLAETGSLSPAAAYWIPNAIIIMGSAVLLHVRNSELNLGIGDRFARLYSRLLRRTTP